MDQSASSEISWIRESGEAQIQLSRSNQALNYSGFRVVTGITNTEIHKAVLCGVRLLEWDARAFSSTLSLVGIGELRWRTR